jgi:hypothetical protein
MGEEATEGPGRKQGILTSVVDLDPEPDPLVRGTNLELDPAPDPLLFS